MSFTLKPHEVRKIKGREVLVARPYIRLRKANEDGEALPTVFIQNGNFYFEDGTVIEEKDLPTWVKPEIAKISPQAKKEVGLTK